MIDPARPLPPATLARPLPFLRALQDNFIGVWPQDSYTREVTRVRIGRRVMVTANAPALVKHVLLDNAANYHKSPIARRLFEPALGQGLLTSEGATWKRHRQMVAPVFVQRRMAALVPAMVAATQTHIANWGREPGASFDLTEALSVITLDIITHTMFGAESSADITTLAADSAAYQKILRPSLLDFLGAPSWVPRPGTREARSITSSPAAAPNPMIATICSAICCGRSIAGRQTSGKSATRSPPS
jgi:cytochrome P450